MKETLLDLFAQYPGLALFISLAAAVLIAVLGLVPSVFLTAANILYFGFWPGTLVSFAGEALGAWVAFFLYRKGFKKNVDARLEKFGAARKLIEAKGREAFLLIVSLRLMPFVPSGVVTFAAAIGSVTTITFVFASTLGKIPALLIEAYSVYQVRKFGTEGKIILFIAAVALLYLALKQLRIFGRNPEERK